MSFQKDQFEEKGQYKQLTDEAAQIQMLHTKFTPTIAEAVIDLREKYHIMEAYGEVTWLSVDLYKVSGIGKHTQKHWKQLGWYDDPLDVPGF
jgi:hypothetical protein